MEENAALRSAMNSVQALGRGFDVNFDTRLLYCKGGVAAGSTVLAIDQDHSRARDACLYDDLVVPNVSRDIKILPSGLLGDGGRVASGVFTYNEMVQYFNKNTNLSVHTPLGSFNTAFSYTGSKHMDAATTKTLSMDGFFIPLAKFELLNSPMILRENVRRAVPTSWDPPALASFIENFGTHVIASVTIVGKDVIYVKQHEPSSLSTMEIKSYVQDIGNQRFSITESLTSSGLLKYKDKGINPFSFNSQGIYPQLNCTPFLPGNGKKDVTVIFGRRGGDDMEESHAQRARTVRCSPDVIELQFFPIAALLEGVEGREYLRRAIDLYLEYIEFWLPQIEELRYFVEFQDPRIWAPLRDSRVPGQSRKEPVCPSLPFSLMGQKLFVSSEQVTVGRKPVTGMRLSLEGPKQNRLCIHLQHLASLPKIFQPYWDTRMWELGLRNGRVPKNKIVAGLRL